MNYYYYIIIAVLYFLILSCRFINIEPSAVDEERDITNASNEENHDSLTLSEKEIVRSATVSGDRQDPNLSITNTTTSPSLSTKFWNEMNIDSKEVNILYNIITKHVILHAMCNIKCT